MSETGAEEACTPGTAVAVLVSTFATWGALYLLIVFWLVNAQSALRGAPLSKLLSNVVYSQLGWYIELVVSAAAVIVYVLFVADTYMSTTTLGVFVVQVGCQTLICCEYFFQLASSSNKLFHVLSSATPMHLLPLIPLIAAVQEGRCRIAGAFELEPGAWADDWPNRSLSFVYILILIRSRMVSRSLAMFLGRVILDGQQGGSTATHLYLGVVIWNLVVAVIFFAGWHLYISLMFEFNQQLNFVDAFYFTIVTIATVGYGDIYPESPAARVFVLLFIVMVVMVFIPRLFAQLNDLFALSSKYNGSFTPRGHSWHVIVSADATCALAMRQFLDEFFHEDHRIDGQVVMLVPGDPGQSGSSEWASLLLLYGTTDQVVYLNGDAVSALDLQRARADTARMVFLLADADSRDSNTQDAKIISRAQTVRSFFGSTPILVQLIEPENQEYLSALGMASRSIVCINELRMKLLAMGVACPGVPTLVSNLITSAAPPDEEIPDEAERQSAALGYRFGQAHEIYLLALPPSLVGACFGDVALAMRDELGACLFALGRASAPEGPSRRTGTLSGLGSASAAASSRPELNVVLHPGHKCPLCEDDVLYLISMEPLTARELELIDERFAEPAELGLSLPTPLELRNRALAALGLGHGSEASGEPSRASSFCARIPGIGSWPATVPVAPRISESGPRLVLSPARESGGCVTEPSRVRETLASMRASAGGSSVVADDDFATVVPSCAASGRAMTLQPASAVVTGANGAAAQPPPAIRFRSLASGSRQGRTPTTSQARQQRMQAQRIDDVARGGANLASMRTRARAVALFTPGEAAGEKAEGARARSPTKAATLLDAAAANAARRRPMRKSSLAVYAMLRRNEVRFGSPIEPNARLQAENDRLPPAAILASGQLHALRRQMMGHIVLVTQSLDDIVIFVSGMRASHLRHRPIVIICPIAAMGSRDAFIEWAEIDHFRGVFLLQGRAETPTLEDLNNAHVRYAECVVVVSSKSLRNAEKSSEQIDLENLITTLSVRAVVGDRVKCVVQLQSGNLVHNFGSPVIAEQPARAQPSAFASIKRFGPRAGASGLPPNPSRRSSEAASSAPAAHPSTSIGKQMLDAAQCLSSDTAASTPGLCSRALAWLSGLGAWLGLGSGRDALEQRRRLLYLDYTLTPHFMSGMLVVTSVVGHLLCQAFFNEASVPVVNALLADDIDSAPLVKIAVPREFLRLVAAGELRGTYDELFRFLLVEHDVLALGLYRCELQPTRANQAGPTDRRQSGASAMLARMGSRVPTMSRPLSRNSIAEAMREKRPSPFEQMLASRRKASQTIREGRREVAVDASLGAGDEARGASGTATDALDEPPLLWLAAATVAPSRANAHSVDSAHPHAPLDELRDSCVEPVSAEASESAARSRASAVRKSPWKIARLALERKLLKRGVFIDDDDDDDEADGDRAPSQPATQFVVITNPPAQWVVRADDSVFVLLRATACLYTPPKRPAGAPPSAAPEHALEVLGQTSTHRLPNVSAFMREREAAPRLGVDEGFIDANTAMISKLRSFEHSLGEKIDKLVSSQQRGEERLTAMENDLARVTRALADLASATAMSTQPQRYAS